jgi:plasmid stabilization system protein ParE
MRLRYSPRATADIIAIADYLTERNPAAARAVDAAIRKTIGLIGEFSGSGRALTQRPKVRVMPLARLSLSDFLYRCGRRHRHIAHSPRRPSADQS